jgi:dihydrofolate synthase / folylpolyglutamate synthase
VEALAQRDHWQLDGDALRHGLRRARLPGRFEHREWRGRSVILDGAHNPIKLAAVVSTLWDLYPRRRFPWVLALKQDKDIHGFST